MQKQIINSRILGPRAYCEVFKFWLKTADLSVHRLILRGFPHVHDYDVGYS